MRHSVAVLCAALLLGAGFAAEPARAGALTDLITDGNFLDYSNLSGAGGYVCGGSSASSCVSNLTYWAATCSQAAGTTGCDTSATPSSLLINPTTGSAWNGNRGLWAYTAPSGADTGNTIAIDGDSNYSTKISQSISGLQIGDRYQLTFYQAAAQQQGLTGATTENWVVAFGGSSQTSATMHNASEGFVAWNLVTMNFIATATTETLSFTAIGTPSGEPPICLLSDAALYDIAEPEYLTLGGAGLLLWWRARQRRTAAPRNA